MGRNWRFEMVHVNRSNSDWICYLYCRRYNLRRFPKQVCKKYAVSEKGMKEAVEAPGSLAREATEYVTEPRPWISTHIQSSGGLKSLKGPTEPLGVHFPAVTDQKGQTDTSGTDGRSRQLKVTSRYRNLEGRCIEHENHKHSRFVIPLCRLYLSLVLYTARREGR